MRNFSSVLLLILILPFDLLRALSLPKRLMILKTSGDSLQEHEQE